jgi:hypothetical protein
MNDEEFPEYRAGRPVWLITLADLALLLIGFFVFVQANQHIDPRAMAKGFREGFGSATAPDSAPDPMPVEVAAMLNFQPGSALLPQSPAGLVAWAREATRDPRVTLKVSGSVDGSPADVDPATGSGAVLAADRARAVAAALAHVAGGRMAVATGAPKHRQVIVTLAFSGDPPRTP